MFFALIRKFLFLAENQETLIVGKIRNDDEKRVFFEKRTFCPFEEPSLQNWGGKEMRVVAGHLGQFSYQKKQVFSKVEIFKQRS